MEKALGYKNVVGSGLNITQMNLKQEDMKYKIVKIFNLVENLLLKN